MERIGEADIGEREADAIRVEDLPGPAAVGGALDQAPSTVGDLSYGPSTVGVDESCGGDPVGGQRGSGRQLHGGSLSGRGAGVHWKSAAHQGGHHPESEDQND